MSADETTWELPEYRDNPLISCLPPILSQAEAFKALIDHPQFDPAERNAPDHIRLHMLQRLNHYFEPLAEHLKLESRLGLMIRQGYISRNPLDGSYLKSLQNDYERRVHQDLTARRHIMSAKAQGLALIGCSGIGKTSAVERTLDLYAPQVRYHSHPFSLHQVVWLRLECPHMGSPKQLCISFFHEMDRLLGPGSTYLTQYGGSSRSVDSMMVNMSHVADLHALGVLVIDEVQHLRSARGVGPTALLNFLVTLVNQINIPVLLIGTLGAIPVLQGDFRQARRVSGIGSLVWERMQPGPTWDHFVDRLWKYQWTREFTPLTPELREILYQESQGIIDVLVKLFLLGQMRAITLRANRKRPETLSRELLLKVAEEDFKMIAPMISALKRGDKAAIAKYDDLKPLNEYVQNLFFEMGCTLEAVSVPEDPVTPSPPIPAQIDPVPRRKKRATLKPVIPDDSIRGIQARCASSGEDLLSALREAGIIRDPLLDIAG